MQKPDRTPLTEFIQNSRPLGLLAGMLLYALGGGVIAYLGESIDWSVYWLGQACVILLQLSSSYLLVYYDRLQEIRRAARATKNPRADQQYRALTSGYLLAAVTTLTMGAMLTVLLLSRGELSPASLLILGLAFLFAFLYAVPPLRLAYTGYGELIAAVLLTNLIPAFAYLLQGGELMGVLGVLSFPLTTLYLAFSLATSLENYFAEIKRGRQNLMIRLGWQRGMFLHNLCILIAYLTIGLSVFFDLPWTLTWPRLLTLPLGLFQVWQIWQISQGAKPRWRLLRITAAASFAITVYLLVFTLWVI
jgi:1,4-dihydroxy-2-naphthoate octaprenyltransferase